MRSSCTSVVLGVLSFFIFANSSFALPLCYEDDRTTVISNSNADVLGYIQNNDRNWHRVMLTGTVTKTLPDQTGHRHFLIDIGGSSTADVEVIHQNDFGGAPTVSVGMTVAVCGDLKLQSMDGVKAFVHWTHCNPGTQQPNHPQGFLSVNGVLSGITAPQGEPACDPNRP